ncbi:MAG TPA: AzlD domain-containing protein [Euzebyales bacterium]|nr:AzlD domain-containing protein [Euzebyales bacterium]
MMVVAVVALAVMNVAYKAVGPVVIGDADFPPRVQVVVDALPAALLAGLLVVDVVGARWADADWTMLPGLGVAGVLCLKRVPHLACILAAVVVTAAVRLAA